MQNQNEPASDLASLIGRLATIIGSGALSNGDRASLRRMTPDAPPPLSFYRFAQQHLREGWQAHQADWVAVCAALAIMGAHGHNPNRKLGQALAQSGYSEMRLESLLSARENTLRSLALRAARQLAAKQETANLADIARLLVTRDTDKREQLRRRIASDFYRQTNA